MARRRGKGEGSIHKRPDRLWTGQITVGYDPTTGKQKRKTVYGKTKKEVQDKILELRNQAKAGTVDTPDVPVKTFLQSWLRDVKGRVNPKTFDRYQLTVERDLLPRFGPVTLAKLTPFHVQELYRKMEEAGRSADARLKAGKALRQALKEAVRLGLIPSSPAAKVRLPKVVREEIRPLSPEQVQAFLAHAESDRLYALYVTALDTGMRAGELFALEWDDVDWGRGEVRVTKSLEEVRGEFRVKETKTKTKASRRRVKLSRTTLEVLEEHRRRMGAEGHGCPRVFSARGGGYLRVSNVLRRSFKLILKEAGLPDVRFHDLRHTMATLMLWKGVNIKAVSERLGHASIQITLDTYSHVMPHMQAEAAEVMGELLRPRGEEKAREVSPADGSVVAVDKQ